LTLDHYVLQCTTVTNPPGHTNIRLTPEEVARVEQVREALSAQMGKIPITKSHAMHAMLAKGYETLVADLKLVPQR
jgi:hypothetical protein